MSNLAVVCLQGLSGPPVESSITVEDAVVRFTSVGFLFRTCFERVLDTIAGLSRG